MHFRDLNLLQHTVPATAMHFARALVMPNLQPALTNIAAVTTYRNRILQHLEKNSHFTPYMTLYLTDTLSPNELSSISASSFILGAKLYPAGATTNSAEGPQSITALYPLLEVMQNNNLVLQIHGEVIHGDIFEREAIFITDYLKPLIRNFPRLRIVLEHISTAVAVEFIEQAPDNIAATITPHHLLYNRNNLFSGGIQPHYYCLPILKHKQDQLALQRAAVSGNFKFFAGTDSAPHEQTKKESACGCAGVYTAPFAIAMYAQLFEQLNQLDKLNNFLSYFGANFYQLPISTEQIELIKQPQIIPFSLPFGKELVIPLAAGSQLDWRINEFA